MDKSNNDVQKPLNSPEVPNPTKEEDNVLEDEGEANRKSFYEYCKGKVPRNKRRELKRIFDIKD